MVRLLGTMVIPLSHLGKWLPFKKLWGKHVCLPIPVGWNGAPSDHYYANIDLHIWYGVLGHEAQTRREMAGFAGYLSASFTTQKIHMVCFLYFYLGEWLFRGSEMNRRKYIGLMVYDPIRHHSFLILRTCKQWQCPQQRWSSTKWKLNILFHIQIT